MLHVRFICRQSPCFVRCISAHCRPTIIQGSLLKCMFVYRCQVQLGYMVGLLHYDDITSTVWQSIGTFLGSITRHFTGLKVMHTATTPFTYI